MKNLKVLFLSTPSDIANVYLQKPCPGLHDAVVLGPGHQFDVVAEVPLPVSGVREWIFKTLAIPRYLFILVKK